MDGVYRTQSQMYQRTVAQDSLPAGKSGLYQALLIFLRTATSLTSCRTLFTWAGMAGGLIRRLILCSQPIRSRRQTTRWMTASSAGIVSVYWQTRRIQIRLGLSSLIFIRGERWRFVCPQTEDIPAIMAIYDVAPLKRREKRPFLR